MQNSKMFYRPGILQALIYAAVVLFNISCGGGGGSSEATINEDPGISITFPPKTSVTKASDLIVRGIASDPGDSANKVVSITLNDSPVTTTNQFANWSLQVALAEGLNTLSATATFSSGEVLTDEIQIKYQPALLDRPNSIVYDNANSRLLVISNPLGSYDESALVGIDVTSGVQSVISNNSIPDDVNPFEHPGPSSLAIDAARDRALLLLRNQVIAVDLISGSRTVLSGENIPDSVNPFSNPAGIVIDPANNRLIVANTISGGETSIIAVDLDTGGRSIISTSTYPNEENQIRYPHYLELDSAHNRVLVAWGGGITAVDLSSGARTVLSDKTTPNANNLPNFSSGIALDSANDRIILADSRNFALFAIDTTTGARSILLDADSVPANILFKSPVDLALDQSGNRLFILDSALKSVTAMDLTTLELTEISSSRFPDETNDHAFVGEIAFDRGRDRVVSVTDTAEGKTAVLTMDGNGGTRSLIAEEDSPYNTYRAVEYDHDNGMVYLSEGFSKAIYAIDLSTGNRSILSGMGTPDRANLLQYVTQMALDSANNRIFACDANTWTIYSIDLGTGTRTVVSDNSTPNSVNPFSQPFFIEYNETQERLLVLDRSLGSILEINVDTGARTVVWDAASSGASVVLDDPRAFAYNPTTNHVFVADINLAAIVDIDLSTGQSTILSDNTTPNSNNPLSRPTGIALDSANNRLFVSDSGSDALLEVDLDTGARNVISNSDIAGSEYSWNFSASERIEYDAINNRIFMVGGSSNGVVEIDVSTDQLTVISKPTYLSVPESIEIDTRNNQAIVISQHNNAVSRVDLASGVYSFLSDQYAYRFPYDVTVNPTTGKAYVIDNIADEVEVINLVSGTSSLLSGPTVPDTNNAFSSPLSIAMDAEGQRVLVVANKKIYSVDASSGSRTILSDESTPNSDNLFDAPRDMVVDTENNRALVLDNGLEAVLSVDLTTGQRTIISDNNTPNSNNPITNYGVYNIESITLDSIRNRLLVNRGEGIIAVDLTDGQRVYLLSR